MLTPIAHDNSAAPQIRKERPKRDRRRVSELLKELAVKHTAPRITIFDLRDALGRRAFGVLLLVFALINLVPLPPGGGIILSLPVLFIAAQQALGFRSPYFPNWLGARSLATEDFKRVLERTMPVLMRLERVLRPRFPWMTGPLVGRFVGLACFILGLVLITPIPFGGNWPPAIAIIVLSLAHLERDGVATCLGFGLGTAMVILVWTLLIGTLKGMLVFFEHMFG